MLLLFSDGASHDQSRAVRIVREMNAKGVTILCVAIGRGQAINNLMKKLQQIASMKDYVFKSNIHALDTIEDSLVKDICERISKCMAFRPERPAVSVGLI